MVFDFLASLFLAAIAILTIIFAYYIRDNNTPGAMLSCKTNYGSILNMYNNIDLYLQQVDQGLCSQSCPCNVSNASALKSWQTYYPSNSFITNNVSGVNNFGLCPDKFQNSTYSIAQNKYALIPNNNTSYNPSFNYSLFAPYWANIENQFNCTGFCNTNYINGIGQNITMVKYLFSDINKGIPSSLGCLPSLYTWLEHFLEVWGAIALTVATIMFVVFILACTYVCCSRDAKYEREPVPVVPVPIPNQNRLVTDNNPNVVLNNQNPVIVRPAGNVGNQELRQY